MAKVATLRVRMDADLKEQAEKLYRSLGTSFPEAVRMFARQSVLENGMPFTPHLPRTAPSQPIDKRIGVAKGKFSVPEDIDKLDG